MLPLETLCVLAFRLRNAVRNYGIWVRATTQVQVRYRDWCAWPAKQARWVQCQSLSACVRTVVVTSAAVRCVIGCSSAQSLFRMSMGKRRAARLRKERLRERTLNQYLHSWHMSEYEK